MEPGLHFATAKDLFEAFHTAGEDILARPVNETALEFLTVLHKSPTPEESITYGAYLLPRRKAVWWGHQCVKRLGHLMSAEDLRMLDLAENWVMESEEPQRVEALTESLAAPDKSPGVWIALAAGWSGGSMAGPEAPRVAPPPYLTPRAVNAGILGALARVDNKHRAPTLKGFVDMGISLATR